MRFRLPGRCSSAGRLRRSAGRRGPDQPVTAPALQLAIGDDADQDDRAHDREIQ